MKKLGIVLFLLLISISFIIATDNSNSFQDPLYGYKYVGSGLVFNFSFVDSENYRMVGVKESGITHVFDEYSYIYYAIDQYYLYLLWDADEGWTYYRYSLSNDNKELKFLYDDGSFLEFTESGKVVKTVLKDVGAVALGIGSLILGIGGLSQSSN